MRKSIVVLIAVILTGCFSAKLITPTQMDVNKVQMKFPNYTLSELNQGKMLYEQHCGSCHRLKSPSSQSEEHWKKIVPDMTKRVNKKNNNTLDAISQEIILKYLITMSTSIRTK